MEGFGGFEDADSEEDIVEHEGFCYLKTKTDSYKKHWIVLSGNEIRFYRKQGDDDHKVMHCLAGTYLKEVTMDEISEKSKSTVKRSMMSETAKASSKNKAKKEEEAAKARIYFPVKLVIPPNKSRLMFFSKEAE